MFNKKRIIAILIFLLLSFFMMTFGNPAENTAVATREVTFVDSYDNKELDKVVVEVGTKVTAPEVPDHRNVIFIGWYYEDTNEEANLDNILEDVVVETHYDDDINNNDIADSKDTYYNVRFINSKTEGTLKTQRVLIGMNATAPVVPAYDGFTFVGWTRSYTNVRSNIETRTIYTAIDTNTYNVTFVDGEDDSIINIAKVESGASASTPIPPVHEKRIFDYWEGNYSNVTKDETVTAIYTDDRNENDIKDYEEYIHLRYNSNGGTPEVIDNNNYLKEDIVNITEEKLTKTDSLFLGWSEVDHETLTTEEMEDEVIFVSKTYKIMDNTTLHAVWAKDNNKNEIPDYKEFYNVNFVASCAVTTPYENIAYESLITIPNFEVNKGYILASEWYTDEELTIDWNFENDKLLENTTLYGNCTKDKYTLTVNPNGGKYNNKTESTVYENVEYTSTKTIEDPERTGYTFTGWELEGTNSKVIEKTFTMGNENATLKATWKVNSYTITFDTKGGNTISPITKNYGEIVTAPSNPTKTGYTFASWDKEIPTTMPAGDMLITASWNINSYKLTVNPNGGKYNNKTENTVYENLNYASTKEIENPERTGYTFAGWELEGANSNLSKTTFTMGSENATLKATWTINKYTLTVNPNGGKYNNKTENTIYENLNYASTKEIENPERTGYTFTGWELEGTNSNLSKTTFTMGSENATLKATWKVNSYTITFDTKGGNTISPITKNYGEVVTAPSDPTKTGYTFASWDKEIPATMPAENITITAGWNINSYTITFDTQGGNTISPITKNYGEVVTAPSNPTKTGHTFDSWDIEIPATMPAENITITASWNINSYTITFDTKGGTAISPITKNYGEVVTAPSDPTKTGYTFDSWDKEIPATMPAENITITAGWNINSYTITFDTQGGNTISPITKNYGEVVTVPSDPTKTGYTFDSWDKEIPATMPAGDMLVTANWSINSYTITFDTKGGNTISPITKNYGEIVTAPSDPTKTGYTFASWDKEIPATMPAGDMLVTASWNINSYKLTVNPNGGKYNNKTENTVYENLNYASTKEIENPERTGYTFAGWELEGANSNLSKTTFTMGSENATLKATWTINKYTLTVNPNGGKYNNKTESTVYENLNYASTKEIENPERIGYTFINWTIVGNNSSLEDKEFTMGNENATLTANWSINSYTITFDTKGGNTILPITKNYGEVVTAPSNPTKTGYTFDSWDKEIPTTMPAGDMLITASWNINSYKLTVNPNGGKYNNKTENTVYENLNYASTKEIENPERTGYTFAGWELEGANSNLSKTTFTMGSENATLKATWTINKYTLTIKPNGGKYDNKTENTVYENVEYGSTKIIENPTRTGYTFTSWTITGNSSTLEDKAFTMGTANATLTANWTKDTYNIYYHLNDEVLEDELVNGSVNNNKITYQVTDASYDLIDASSDSHDFTGWFTAAENGSKVTTLDSGSTGDKHYYAYWTIKINNVIFMDGEEEYETIPVEYNEDIETMPKEPEHPGYECSWDPQTVTNVTAQTIVNLVCSAVNYTVTYDLNKTVYEALTGETNPNTLNKYTINTPTYTLLDATSKSHTFAGWFTEADGGSKVTTIAGGKIGNTTLYAHWTANLYTVGFDSNGGTTVQPITNVLYNSLITKPADPTKLGYNLDGWYKESNLNNKWDFMTDTVKTSLVLYAKWSEEVYNLTFVLNDKNESNLVTNAVNPTNESTYTISSDITFNNATSDSHNFNGWYDAEVNGNKVIGITPGTTGNKILYGNWTIKTYTITFKDTNNNEIIKKVNWNGTLIDIPTITAVKGYDCSWEEKTLTNIKSNIIVNSVCDLSTYKLEVDPNNGAWVGTTPQSIQYTKTSTINDPTRTGYTFNGWSLVGEGSSLVGKTFTMGTANAKLTANWIINKYTVTVDPNGGLYNNTTEVTAYNNVEYQETKTINDPTMVGYIFGSWTLSDTTSTIKDTLFTMGSANVTLTANWNPATDTAYKVNHYQQNLDGTYPKVPTLEESKQGTTGENTEAVAQSYEGFKLVGTVTQQKIAADGKTTINLYYERQSYTLTLVKGVNITSVSGAGTFKYGSKVTIDAVLDSVEGYNITFNRWSSNDTETLNDLNTKNSSFEMPAGNITLEAIANKTEIIPNVKIDSFRVTNYPDSNNKEAEPGSTVNYELVLSNAENRNVTIKPDLSTDGVLTGSYVVTYISANGSEKVSTLTDLDTITIPTGGKVKITFSATVNNNHAVNSKFNTKVVINTKNNTEITKQNVSTQIEKSASVISDNLNNKNITLILDFSGSMADDDKIGTLKTAATKFVNNLKNQGIETKSNIALTIIGIGAGAIDSNRACIEYNDWGDCTEMINYTQNYDRSGMYNKMDINTYAFKLGSYNLNNWVPTTLFDDIFPYGGTNITGSLTLAENILKNPRVRDGGSFLNPKYKPYRDKYDLEFYTENSEEFVVLLTDGANGPQGETHIDKENDTVKYIRNNTTVFAIGFGDGATSGSNGYNDLLAITDNAAAIYEANNEASLNKAFNTIANKIGETQSVTGKIEVDLPQNGINYYPILFSYVNNGVKTTLFTINKVDDLLIYPEVTISNNKLTWNISGNKYSNYEGLKVELTTEN